MKKVFKTINRIGKPIKAGGIDVVTGESGAGVSVGEGVSGGVVDDIQGQLDDVVDSIESAYQIEYVFDKFDYFISTKPFYFQFEVPLGTTEIVSARLSFEVKDYRNENLTDSRYAITGDSTDRPTIEFTISEDKGCKYGSKYGGYTTDMRAIDILSDLTGEGIKIVKLVTDNDCCVMIRVFLKVKINKDETPEGQVLERPEVRTLAATSICGVSATLNGDIISVGKGNITDRSTGEITPITCTKRGFKYATTQADTNDESESDTYVKGEYDLGITGLTPETDYFFRAYAENQVGRGYGEYVKLTTIAQKNIYVVYKKTSDSKYYLVKINYDDSVTAIAELPELITGNSPELVRILTDNSGNIYALKQNDNGYPLPFTHTLYKYNSSGVLQVTKVMAENEMFGFITSDYLYTMVSNDDEIHKRSLTDLETAETISLTSGHRFYYLCFDSDGYLYTYDRDYTGEAAFIKWEIGVGISDYHQQGLSSLSAWADFALLGTTIAHDYLTSGYASTLAINLDSDLTGWSMDDIDNQVCGVASNTAYWYVLGENTADDALIVEKYNSSKTLQTTITVSADYITGANRQFANAITAYPF